MGERCEDNTVKMGLLLLLLLLLLLALAGELKLEGEEFEEGELLATLEEVVVFMEDEEFEEGIFGIADEAVVVEEGEEEGFIDEVLPVIVPAGFGLFVEEANGDEAAYNNEEVLDAPAV
jgi:hypothetical protein